VTLPAYALPFGLRDVKVAAMTGDATYGALVDLPASRTLAFAESEETEELRGDDTVVARRGTGKTVTWSLESGGVSLDVMKVLMGGTQTLTGTPPNEKETLAMLGTDSRPYFKIEGQIINDNGGDLHAVIYRAKLDGDVGGEFTEGAFYLTAADGIGIPRVDGKLFDIVHNETAAAIT
jgi:hypothetical protein